MGDRANLDEVDPQLDEHADADPATDEGAEEIHMLNVDDPLDIAFDPEFLEPEGIDNEANDDFDHSELPEDENHWRSPEEEKELWQQGNCPTATNWNVVPDADLKTLTVSVDKAKRSVWKKGKTEICILRKHWLENHLTDKPSFDCLCRELHGNKSPSFHIFQSELDLDHKTFCRFLATFHSASMWNVPAPRLCDTDRFDAAGLLKTKEDFMTTLRRMETIDKGTRGDTLWMKTEHAFNSQMRKMFLSKRGDEKLSIALDDDKVHFNCNRSAPTHGLKKHRHTRDNRFGHTLHTAGFSATGAILEAAFEREGESSTDCHEKAVKDPFGSSTGSSAPDLRGTTWHSDRGCWTPTLLFDKLLRWGGDVVGTVARCFWHPFAFSKIGKNSDADRFKRKEMPMKGHRDTFCMTSNWLHAKIRATCCRSGTGTAVSLAMSSAHHSPLFDLNLSFPKDHRDHFDLTQTQDDRNKKAFPCVCGDSACHSFVKLLPIAPLTRVQGDTSWFIMRMLGLTSSTVDNMISARAGEITHDHEKREVCETVLSAVDRLNLSPRNNATTDEDDASSVSTTEADDVSADRTEFHAKNWIRRVDKGEDEMFRFRLETLDEEIVRKIVDLHENSKSDVSMPRLRKQLVEWSRVEHPLKRRCHWFKKADLVERTREIDPTVNTSEKKAELLDLAVEVEEIQSNRAAAIAAGDDPFSNALDPVLPQAIKCSFMRPLKDNAKRCCRQGHELERPFLLQFFEHSRQGKTGDYEAIAVFETPLVKSSFENLQDGILDSSDAELVCSLDGDVSTMPTEIKARLSHSTFTSERERLESNLGLQAFENDGEPCCVELDADGNLCDWIPKHKECFQLMHHVAVGDLRKGLILVGNSREVMFGVFVDHSDELIQAHQSILHDSFERTLKPFHEPIDDLQLPRNKIAEVIKSKSMKPIGLDWHSFSTSHCIWRRLRLDGDVNLPIPPCNRILPLNHSVWNDMKGASDTATNLFWNCQVKLANFGRSQTVCIGRFLQLHAVCVHRQNHVAAAKADLNVHGSLCHFRNARNRHWPFHKTVKHIAECLTKMAEDEENHAAEDLQPVAIPLRTPPRTARDNPTRPFVEDRFHATVCGATPGRGRDKFPKAKSLNWEEDQRRLHNCLGNLFVLSENKRNPCHLCGTNTRCICSGCKRAHCPFNRHDKIHDLILKKDPVVDFLNGVCPPADLNIKAVAKDGVTKGFATVQNSCHHVCHKAAVSLSAAVTLSRTPLGSTQEKNSDKEKWLS